MSLPVSVLLLVFVLWLVVPAAREDRSRAPVSRLWWLLLPLGAALALAWGNRLAMGSREVTSRMAQRQVLAGRYRAVRDARDAVLAEIASERALRRLARSPRERFVLVDSGVPSAAGAFIEEQVQREVQRLALSTDVQRVFITRPVSDSARSDALRARRPLDVSWLLPDSARAQCVTIVRLNRDEVAQLQVALGTSVLGPCSLVARFGRPGPGIDRWLRVHAYAFAAYAAWDSADRPLYGTRNVHLGREGLPVRAAQCVMGDGSACREQLGLTAANGDEALMERSPVTFRDFSLGGDQLGYVERLFISDMVLSLGPDRFGAFWRSNDEAERAFKAAAGEELSAYTSRWLGRTYDDTPGGPRVASASLTALLLAATLLALVMRRGLR